MQRCLKRIPRGVDVFQYPEEIHDLGKIANAGDIQDNMDPAGDT